MEFSPGPLRLHLVDQKPKKGLLRSKGPSEPISEGHELTFWCVKGTSLKNPIKEIYRIFCVRNG